MLAEDRAAGRQRDFLEMAAAFLRQPVPTPKLWPEVAAVLSIHGRLGTDANGTPLLAERRQFFDMAQLEPGLEAAVDEWFEAIDQELADIRAEQIDEMKANRGN
jgi:hypothetical protein